MLVLDFLLSLLILNEYNEFKKNWTIFGELKYNPGLFT